MTDCGVKGCSNKATVSVGGIPYCSQHFKANHLPDEENPREALHQLRELYRDERPLVLSSNGVLKGIFLQMKSYPDQELGVQRKKIIFIDLNEKVREEPLDVIINGNIITRVLARTKGTIILRGVPKK